MLLEVIFIHCEIRGYFLIQISLTASIQCTKENITLNEI